MFEKRDFQEKNGPDDDIGCSVGILFQKKNLLTHGSSGIYNNIRTYYLRKEFLWTGKEEDLH